MTTTLAITGWGTLNSLAFGADAFASALAAGRSGLADVRGMFDESLPFSQACAMVDFDVREHLGRKGTRHMDRSTAMAVTAAGLALADAGLRVSDDNRDNVGVVLGTTVGSVRSTAEFDRETLVNDRPYLVEPVLFPNAVMNCAASRCAIWHQLRGVNCTLPSGQLSAVTVLRYGRMLIHRRHARTLLLGAVEELSPHRSWAEYLLHTAEHTRVPLGEAAVVLVAEDADEVRAAGRSMDAEILACSFGQYAPPDKNSDLSACLADQISLAMSTADVTSADVTTVATGERGDPRLDEAERSAVHAVFGSGMRRTRIKELAGECGGAAGMMQIADVLARHRHESSLDGAVSVVTSCAPDGTVGAMVLRGWSRNGVHRCDTKSLPQQRLMAGRLP